MLTTENSPFVASDNIRASGPSRKLVDPPTIALAAREATVYRGDDELRALPHAAAEPREIDACVYLLTLCRHLQATYLEPKGIECLFDADDAGSLPDAVCHMLGFMVSELVADSISDRPRAASGGAIALSLRRRGATCLCTVSCRGGPIPLDRPRPGLERVQSLAAELGGSCMVRSMPSRGMTAIMFDSRSVNRRCSGRSTKELSR